MTPDDINRAKDAIAARSVYGDDTRDSTLTQAATDAHADYVRLSMDPKFGWSAALDEMAKLRIELRNMLNSASPDPLHHPAMTAAWASARRLLGDA